MTFQRPTIGIDIKCFVCHARLYPELSLPEVVRESFDLIKLVENRDDKTGEILWWRSAGPDEGLWFCRLHRAGFRCQGRRGGAKRERAVTPE
jgi:hypothetical protein